jgi:hypothetical protein
MSTTADFVSIGNFPFCPQLPSTYTPGFEDGVLVGPFTLSQAMALFWNAEIFSFNAQGNTLTISTSTNPHQRVCYFYYASGVDYWSSSNIKHDLVVNHNLPYVDGSGNYWFRVRAHYYTDITANFYFSLFSTPQGDYVFDHSFTATVLGVSMTVYAHRYESEASWAGGADTYSVSCVFFTY